METNGDKIPDLSNFQSIDTNGGLLKIIDIYMPDVRNRMRNNITQQL